MSFQEIKTKADLAYTFGSWAITFALAPDKTSQEQRESIEMLQPSVLADVPATIEESLLLSLKALTISQMVADQAYKLAYTFYDRDELGETGSLPWRVFHLRQGITTSLGQLEHLLNETPDEARPSQSQLMNVFGFALNGMSVADGSYQSGYRDD